ncbi:MAG: catechol-2,3-dioxygenase [Saprospiraceae bacterium]|jgi:catechol-2,3-dioxygenase
MKMRIRKLKIFTSDLSAQKVFYKDTLGLVVVNETIDLISLRIGESILTIEQRDEATPYHFAINIPANQEHEALSWLKTKVEIVRDGKNEIQDFDFWNAKAIYFYDADNNIVEFIARKNLDNSSKAPFNQNSLLEISEIGIPTINIEEKFKILNEALGLKIFSGSFESFCAIGGEMGLFICINKDKKDWYPKNDKAFSSDFSALFAAKSMKYSIDFYQDKLKITRKM